MVAVAVKVVTFTAKTVIMVKMVNVSQVAVVAAAVPPTDGSGVAAAGLEAQQEAAVLMAKTVTPEVG